MNNRLFSIRTAALFLISALCAPSPSFALHTEAPQETPVRVGLEERLRTSGSPAPVKLVLPKPFLFSAGLEEWQEISVGRLLPYVSASTQKWSRLLKLVSWPDDVWTEDPLPADISSIRGTLSTILNRLGVFHVETIWVKVSLRDQSIYLLRPNQGEIVKGLGSTVSFVPSRFLGRLSEPPPLTASERARLHRIVAAERKKKSKERRGTSDNESTGLEEAIARVREWVMSEKQSPPAIEAREVDEFIQREFPQGHVPSLSLHIGEAMRILGYEFVESGKQDLWIKNTSTGLEEGQQARRVAADEVAAQFREKVRDALAGVDAVSMNVSGRGVILDGRIGPGVLTVAAALKMVEVPVAVVETDPSARVVAAKMLNGKIPVVGNFEEAEKDLWDLGAVDLVRLTPEVTPTAGDLLRYLQEIRLLPLGDLQPLLTTGLEEGKYQKQVEQYL